MLGVLGFFWRLHESNAGGIKAGPASQHAVLVALYDQGYPRYLFERENPEGSYFRSGAIILYP